MCDKDINECTSNPCQNSGRCENVVGSYKCFCTAGFSGKNCSININECDTQNGTANCKNNGTCIDGDGKYTCNCSDPFTGNFDLTCISLLAGCQQGRICLQ